MKVLVTGAAGFIGYHVARRLVSRGRCEVLGVDNLGDYYDVALKRARIAELSPLEGFRFLQADFAEEQKFKALYSHFKPDYVVHLGAQPGVRYSAENPAAYVHSNLAGFISVLEAARQAPPKHIVYASSSSVYGAGPKPPFREDASTDHPISFYGATKKSNEVIAEAFATTHGLRITGLRFFTAYGPWGRPDMSPTLFAQAITGGKPVRLFNQGRNLRDFTYIDDIVDGVLKILLHPGPSAVEGWAPSRPKAPAPADRLSALSSPRSAHEIYNIGHNRPVEMLLFVKMLEQLLGKKAELELLPAQPGDMTETCADLTKIHAAVGYTPKVSLEDGLARFVTWFREYYKPV